MDSYGYLQPVFIKTSANLSAGLQRSPGINMYTNTEKHAEYDYSLAIKNRGRPSKPWRWEIYTAGKGKPVRQSEFFQTMSEATRTGKAALAEIQAKRVPPY